MITWNRLLAGRLKDPLVGRDILIAAAAGTFLGTVAYVGHLLPVWLGYAPSAPIVGLIAPATGLRQTLAQILLGQANAVVNPLVLLLFILLARVVLKRQWLAVGIMYVVFVALGTSQAQQPWISLALFMLVWFIVLFVLIRFGVLPAMMLFLFANFPSWVPLTTDLSRWYATHSLVTMGIMVALALYGFFVSQAGRSLFGKDLLAD
jgi:hypothetical protein